MNTNVNDDSKNILIIGGGAAGFFAAAHLANAGLGKNIAILEQAPQPLAKVKISGGGRCNITNACYDLTALTGYYPRGGKELLGPFTKFGPAETFRWFQKIGVNLTTEADGRVFPSTNSSQTVIDALMRTCLQGGARLMTSSGARQISRGTTDSARFIVTDSAGIRHHARFLIIAAGSSQRVWDMLGKTGHTIHAPVPSLFALRCPDSALHSLAGISVPHASIFLEGKKKSVSRGALLITHRGFSGPSALAFSSRMARELHELDYRCSLIINWIGERKESVLSALNTIKAGSPAKPVAAPAPFGLPARLWHFLLARAGIDGNVIWNDTGKKNLEELSTLITGCPFAMDGKDTNKEEFVTCGGVALREVDFRTMESKILPGMYFAGEMLDIDALTGGFNFQAAWTTAFIAAEAIIRECGDDEHAGNLRRKR